MDLGHDGGINQARDVEQPIVVPVRIGAQQAITYGVVLPDEKGVEHRQPDPPVAVEPGNFNAFVVDAAGSSRIVSRSLPYSWLRRRSQVALSLP